MIEQREHDREERKKEKKVVCIPINLKPGGRGRGQGRRRALRLRPLQRPLQADQGHRGAVPPDGVGRDVLLRGRQRGRQRHRRGRRLRDQRRQGHSNVLFKPTKAAEFQFRPTPEEAMSYFVGGKVVDGGYDEDGGFAINGGKGWKSCKYDNHKVELKGGLGIAMGNYYFTCATTGDVSKVEYTFGYGRCDDGKVRIFLHHSSVPYSA